MTAGTPAIKKALISGGTGFVGSSIARALAEQHPGCDITLMDLTPPGSTHHALPSNISFIKADVTCPDQVEDAVEQVKPDVFFHTAGVVPVLSERYGRGLEQQVLRINFDGTRNALAAAKLAGVPAFVFTSTCCTITDDMDMPYPNVDERWPTAPSSLIYGESKVYQCCFSII